MAKQTCNGTFVGKLGNYVGKKGKDGKYIVVPYTGGGVDPKTPAQMEVRAKMALSGKIASLLGIMGDEINVANGFSHSRKGLLVKQLIAGTYVDQLGNVHLSSNLNLVITPKAKGDFAAEGTTLTITAPEAMRSGSVQMQFRYEVDSTQPLQRILGVVMVYDETTQNWVSRSAIFTEKDGTISVPLPSPQLVGHSFQAYGFAMAVELEEGSALALSRLAGEPESFIVSMATAAAAGQYAYSQVVSLNAHSA